jgi:cation-transporting ATPase 13A3/4/5
VKSEQQTLVMGSVNTHQTAWLMLSMVVLSVFNVLVLLAPPEPVRAILTLMTLPVEARLILLFVAAGNVVLSLAFEQWGSQVVASVVGGVMRRWQQGRRRVREGKVYKVVEGGMR